MGNVIRKWLLLVEAEQFDPLRLEHWRASFLFVDGEFIAVSYQSHYDALAKIAGIKIPTYRENPDERARIGREVNVYAAGRGIVQGTFTPGGPRLNTSMSLMGTLPAMRKAFAAFRKLYPDLLANLDAVVYDTTDTKGERIDGDFIEGAKIDRKFGRRS